MANRIYRFVKKQWLLIWIVAVSVTLFSMSFIVFAEYTATVSSMHRVVVSKAGPGMRFSSNILVESGDNVYRPKYTKTKASGTYDCDLYLWNYSLDDLNSLYPLDINYDLEFKLTDKSGNDLAVSMGNRSITVIAPDNTFVVLNDSNTSGSFTNQKLAYGSVSDTDHFIIRFSSGWSVENDDDYCIRVRAVPTLNNNGNVYQDLRTISGVIGLKTTSSSASNGWKASISEKTDTNSPVDFDGYNLIVSGSGAATITIKWDTSKVELNKYFYDNLKKVYSFAANEVIDQGVDLSGWHTLVINADTGDTAKENRNRYSIQLYKKGILDDTTDPATWDTLFAYNKASDEQTGAWIRVNISQ